MVGGAEDQVCIPDPDAIAVPQHDRTGDALIVEPGAVGAAAVVKPIDSVRTPRAYRSR